MEAFKNLNILRHKGKELGYNKENTGKAFKFSQKKTNNTSTNQNKQMNKNPLLLPRSKSSCMSYNISIAFLSFYIKLKII